MAPKSNAAFSWSPLVTLDTYRTEPRARHVVPRIETLSHALQRHPSMEGVLMPVIVLRGTVADDGDEGFCTVKTFSRTDHTQRKVLVTLDIISESRESLAPGRQAERPLVITVRADPHGASFATGPYEVLIQGPEGRPLARGELVFSENG